jgi:hypothetical protein
MYTVSGLTRGQGLFPLFENAQVCLVVQDFLTSMNPSIPIMRSVRIAGVRIPVTSPKPPNSDQAPSRCRDPQSISTTPSQTNSILSPLPNRTRSLLLVKPLWPPPLNANPVTNTPGRFPERSFPSWPVVESTSFLLGLGVCCRYPSIAQLPVCRASRPLPRSLDRPTETSTRPNGESILGSRSTAAAP